MENSYRALMIVAGVFLGVMLLSLFVYVFRAGAQASKSMDESQIKQQLIAENNKFEQYNRNNNTITDMVSLINLVYDYNAKRDFIEGDCMKLTINIGSTAYTIPKSKIDGLTRNKIVKSDNSIASVYDLVSKPISEIGTTFTGATTDDSLSLTRLVKNAQENNETNYKYLFKPISNYKYDVESGHISEMTFEVYTNSEY